MIGSGPSLAELGINIEPAEISLHSLLPTVNSQVELQRLVQTVGQSGKNEVQRSAYYRSKPQIDFLRSHVNELATSGVLSILNIGPAQCEEASTYAVVASNAHLLNKTTIRFVDLATREMIQPYFGLGINILKNPIEPQPADRTGFALIDGQWQANPEIQQFINSSLNTPGNAFGTAIEEFLRRDDGERYQLVTFNNVAQYLGRGVTVYDNPFYQDEGDFSTFQAVLLSVAERVKEGGFFFAQTGGGVSGKRVDTAAVDKYLHKNSNFDDIFETVDKKAGIYKRKSPQSLIIHKDNQSDSNNKPLTV